MNKKLIVLLVVILLGVGGYFVWEKYTSVATDSSQEAVARAALLAKIDQSVDKQNEKMVEIEGKNKPLYDNQIAKINNAIEVLRRGEKVAVNDQYNAWVDMATVLEVFGLPELAEPAYLEAIKVSEVAFSAWNNLGGLYNTRGEYEKAANAYENFLKHYPLEAEIAAKLFAVYAYGLEDGDRALLFAQEKLVAYQDNVKRVIAMLNVVGEYYAKTGEKSEASVVYNDLIRLDPANKDVYQTILNNIP